MKLLYTVKEVFADNGYLSIEQMNGYKIPVYQRGYKWTQKEVQKLLSDINSFNPSDEKFYCLQNITIVPDKESKVFNVVDGQQRLTTLTLLLSFLEEKKLVCQKVTFPENSIREQTNNFLNLKVINGDGLFLNDRWQTFISRHSNYDHQDIYHLFHACKAIQDWFKNKDILKDAFRIKLLDNVKLIINRIESKNDEEEIFSNLNSKKIPLDGADLFRAILITRAAAEENKKETSIKEIIELNEKRVKIGWEFDAINNWWSKKNVKDYFKVFVAKTYSPDQHLFDHEKHPINLLLSLFSESEGSPSLTLEFLESYSSSALILYKKLQKIHHTLQDWHQDREIYHYLGFLFNNSTLSFKTVWDMWRQNATREDFKQALKKLIRKEILFDENQADYTDLSIDWYHDRKRVLIQVLILMDIIYSLDKAQPFMKPLYFTKNSNDIEHIFPQNPEDPKDKKEFVIFLNNYISKEKFDIDKFDEKIASEEFIEEVERFIAQHTKNIKTHSIGNLVLLYGSLNRSMGRKPYSQKRLKVIHYHNAGNYIQPHSFRVFVRYFSNQQSEVKELQHWTNHDIEANANYIGSKIKNFINAN